MKTQITQLPAQGRLTMFCLLLGLLLVGWPGAQAQDPGGNGSWAPAFSRCFDLLPPLPPGKPDPNPGPTLPPSSTYGYELTPRGDLRILIIFAGVTEDVNPNAVDYHPHPIVANNVWPQ
jgi:hypothetical protein